MLSILLPLGSEEAAASLRHEIYEMPLPVQSVYTLGWWRIDDMEGFFRVIVTEHRQRYVRNKLWLQWICRCEKGRIAMVGIREISDSEPYRFISEPKFDHKQGLGLINMIIINSRTKEEKEIQIQLKGQAEYQLVMRPARLDP